MSADAKSAEQLFVWNRRAFSIGGMWPLSPTYIYFYVNYIYFVIHMALSFTNLYIVFGDMQLIIENLLENSIQAMFSIKMIFLRHSKRLRIILRRLEDSTNEDNYRDDKEKKLYLAYNSIGKAWFKGLHFSGAMTAATYYTGPLTNLVMAAINNETLPQVLPFKTHVLFDIQDMRIYTLMYIWQLPVCYYYYCHAASVALFCTLVVHVTGEMSILAYRIRHAKPAGDVSEGYDNLEVTFRDIINKHLQIMWQASMIDDMFSLVLLEELMISTVLFGFVVFNLLSTSGSLYEKMFLANYCVVMLGMILVYCITGDYVIRESSNIYGAYYECLWYEMKTKYQKNLIICMAQAQHPLQLTAGGFYIFSLDRFSEILKTAMAYVTMLRTVM